jgi:hypothetical protein
MIPLLRQPPRADSVAKNNRLSSRARLLIRILSVMIAMMAQLMANQRALCHLVDFPEATLVEALSGMDQALHGQRDQQMQACLRWAILEVLLSLLALTHLLPQARNDRDLEEEKADLLI